MRIGSRCQQFAQLVSVPTMRQGVKWPVDGRPGSSSRTRASHSHDC
jgi:hypothetical protein